MRLRERELRLPGLPPALDGVRVAHLSDFHLGVPSRGEHATERAFYWVAERRPDLVCLTGDLVSRVSGQERLDRLLERIGGTPYIVLGNHDFAISRDPFSEPVQLLELGHGELLFDRAVEIELRGVRIEIAGVDPRSWLAKRSSRFAASGADFHLLLCHFPRVLERVPPGRWDLVLAGHLHAGQIVVPYGRKRRLLLAHVNARYAQGVFTRGSTTMHVSAGLGTTFVPFRFFARPEATELVLRCA